MAIISVYTQSRINRISICTFYECHLKYNYPPRELLLSYTKALNRIARGTALHRQQMTLLFEALNIGNEVRIFYVQLFDQHIGFGQFVLVLRAQPHLHFQFFVAVFQEMLKLGPFGTLLLPEILKISLDYCLVT